MVPVILLSDGYLANGSEPWRIPDAGELPEIPVRFRTEKEGFRPYQRDPQTLARPWAVPGTAGLEHRVGGLEKEDGTGNVNYEPLNHEKMIHLRAAKVAAVAQDIPPVVPTGDPEGDVLVIGWGSTFGSITAAVRAQREKGRKVGLCGQAPSDRPEFARFLADVGLDSISVTADALPRVVEILADGPRR